MTKNALPYLLLVIFLLAACDDYEPYQPAPTRVVPTNTKQVPKPPPTWTPKPLPTQIPQKSDPMGLTNELLGGGKQDAPSILTVQNLTSEVICQLFIWPSNTGFTNQNLLGGNLNPGQSYKLQQQFQAGDYHLLAVACGGYKISRDTFLTGTQTWKLNYFPK